MSHQYDIVIVGAGLVGSCMACALATTSYKVALIDSQPITNLKNTTSINDGRSIALALSSKYMLSALGLWDRLDANATPIKNIHISDQGHFGATRLSSKRYEVESFGYLVPAKNLVLALESFLRTNSNIDRLQPFNVSNVSQDVNSVTVHGEAKVIKAKLLVAADGVNSVIRNKLGIECNVKKYKQTAIVGSIKSELRHKQTAYERFTREGPLAFLPRQNNCCGFIWMCPSATADEYSALPNAQFLNKLQKAFGQRLGKLSQLSRRYTYPLSLSVSQHRTQQRTVLLGNSAQTLHPIAGQGLNLAIREIAELMEILTSAGNAMVTIEDKLKEYESKRQPDITKTIKFTDRLNFLFTVDFPILSQSRGLGLALLGAIPLLEEKIVRQNLGESSTNAKLLKGMPLRSSHV